MGGEAPGAKKTPGQRAPANPGAGCDLKFDVDLVGVRAAALTNLKKDDVLDVALVAIRSTVSAVCQTQVNPPVIVGALAAFRGLAQLIHCLQTGVKFEARVTGVSAGRCSVSVYKS
jgi:hypothetical protein